MATGGDHGDAPQGGEDDVVSTVVAVLRESPIVVPFPPGGAIHMDDMWPTKDAGGGAAKLPPFGLAGIFSPSGLRMRMADDPDLASTFSSFQDYYLSPLHLARTSRMVTEGTFKGYVKNWLQYLAWIHAWVDPQYGWHLTACMDGPKLLGFISFRKVVQNNQASTLTRTIFELKAVMRWCKDTVLQDTDEVGPANELIGHMDRLGAQLKASAPVKQPVTAAELEAKGKWMPWDTLVAHATQYCEQTLVEVREMRKLKPTPKTTSTEAVELATKLNTCVGGLLYAGLLNTGPPRPFVLKSLVIVAARYSEGVVEDPAVGQCSVCGPDNLTCVGNVMRWVDAETIAINITHHKMLGKTGKVIPQVDVKKGTDHLAFAILREVFKWAHSSLVEYYDPCHEASAADRKRLFRSLSNGKVMRVGDNGDNMAVLMVSKIVAEVTGVSQLNLRLNANLLRKIYTTWVKEQRTAGMMTADEEQGCALAMGTSITMFNSVYQMERRRALSDQSRATVRAALGGAVDETADMVEVLYYTHNYPAPPPQQPQSNSHIQLGAWGCEPPPNPSSDVPNPLYVVSNLEYT